MFYVGKTFLEYASRRSVLQPQIDHLAAETEQLVEEAENEAVLTSSVRERSAALRDDLAAQRSRLLELRQHVEAERQKQKRLQVAIYRKRIRSSRRVLTP